MPRAFSARPTTDQFDYRSNHSFPADRALPRPATCHPRLRELCLWAELAPGSILRLEHYGHVERHHLLVLVRH